MTDELEILRRRITELECLKSKYEQSEETLRQALQQSYNNLEEHTAYLMSANKQLQQEIVEHERVEYELYYRAEFEKLIVNISANFIKLSKDKIHSAIKNSLKMIGKFIGVDHGYVFLFSGDRKRIGDIYEWCSKGIRPQIRNLKGHLVGKELPWFAKKIKRRGVFLVTCRDTLPPEAHAEKEYLKAHGIQSFIALPMFCGRSFIGCMGFDSVHEKKIWTIDIIAVLRIVGEIFANALERNWVEERTRKRTKKYLSLF